MVVEYRSSSPFFTTAQRNFFVSYLDVQSFRAIPAHSSDEIIKVSPRFDQRPDLLSNDLYGVPDLWWIFVIRNPDIMTDPIYDLVAGLEIYAPTKERAFSLLGL